MLRPPQSQCFDELFSLPFVTAICGKSVNSRASPNCYSLSRYKSLFHVLLYSVSHFRPEIYQISCMWVIKIAVIMCCSKEGRIFLCLLQLHLFLSQFALGVISLPSHISKLIVYRKNPWEAIPMQYLIFCGDYNFSVVHWSILNNSLI